jgi:hypothetical protein
MKVINPLIPKFPLILNNLDEYNKFKENSPKFFKLNNFYENWFPIKSQNDFPCGVEPIYHHEQKDLILKFKFDMNYFYYKIQNKVFNQTFSKQKQIWDLIKDIN